MKELYVLKDYRGLYGRGKEEKANNPSLKEPMWECFHNRWTGARYFCLWLWAT
jgi:hypothetical protein